jgi:hypothetical protein
VEVHRAVREHADDADLVVQRRDGAGDVRAVGAVVDGPASAAAIVGPRDLARGQVFMPEGIARVDDAHRAVAGMRVAHQVRLHHRDAVGRGLGERIPWMVGLDVLDRRVAGERRERLCRNARRRGPDFRQIQQHLAARRGERRAAWPLVDEFHDEPIRVGALRRLPLALRADGRAERQAADGYRKRRQQPCACHVSCCHPPPPIRCRRFHLFDVWRRTARVRV